MTIRFKKPAPKKKTVKRARLLTFVGASIVLTTFIVKDGFKERLKDLNDSIIATENAIGIEDRIDTLGIQQLTTDLSLENLSNKIDLQTGREMDYASLVRSASVMLQQRETSIDLEYENLLRLIEELPRSGEIRKQAEQIKAQVDELKKKIEELRTQSLKGKPDSVTIVGIKLGLVTISVSELQLIVFYDAVLTRAKQVRAGYETLYGICRWLAYALYVAGWFVALYGRLHDIEGFAVAE